MGKYVDIDISELERFVEKLGTASKGDFKKELSLFLEALGFEFLRILEDEIIEKKTVDTRLLLNSFQKGTENNIYTLNEQNLTLQVGTNVKYASYVNDGHWTCKQGEFMRFVPGYWSGDKFVYDSNSKTGMVLKQQWVPGSHYWDSALIIMQLMLPELMEARVKKWLLSYFG